jgi:hypothetical protein
VSIKISAPQSWMIKQSPVVWGLLRQAAFEGCTNWLNNDWQRSKGEDSMTAKLLKAVTDSLKKATPQINQALTKAPIRGSCSFDYREFNLSEEARIGADFAIYVEMNIANTLQVERYSLFQAKLLRGHSASIDPEQLSTIRDITSESFYVFYNSKTKGTKSIPYVVTSRNVAAMLPKGSKTIHQSKLEFFARTFDDVLVESLISLWEGDDKFAASNKIKSFLSMHVPYILTIKISSEQSPNNLVHSRPPEDHPPGESRPHQPKRRNPHYDYDQPNYETAIESVQ